MVVFPGAIISQFMKEFVRRENMIISPQSPKTKVYFCVPNKHTFNRALLKHSEQFKRQYSFVSTLAIGF